MTSSGVANAFTQVAFTYVVLPGESNTLLNNIALQYISSGGQSYLDSVNLSVAAPAASPEPSTYSLMAFGTGALVLVSLRRKILV